MSIAKRLLAGSTALALMGCSAVYVADPASTSAVELEQVTLTAPEETDQSALQVLFWNDATRSANFRDMERLFAGHEVPAATNVRQLTAGRPLPSDLQQEIAALMAESQAAGVMVLKNGSVRYENYGLGMDADDRWTSFSVAKSFTSTLLGAAIRDGFIGSLDDPVTRYVPELAGSSYDGVTVKQLATMTSGVAWNENYTDPSSDVAQLNRFVVEYGPDAIIEQMKRLGRAAPAGEKWNYSTGETNLIGVVIENSIGQPLAEYAQIKIVEPAGFEGGMFWMTDPRGGNVGGCCLSLRLSDYARMGQFVLDGGEGIVPEGWFADAGSPIVDFGAGAPGFGYGYQWWTYPGGNYGAQGIFGQSITLVPSKGMVLAVVSNWPAATSNEYRAKWRDVAGKIAAVN